MPAKKTAPEAPPREPVPHTTAYAAWQAEDFKPVHAHPNNYEVEADGTSHPGVLWVQMTVMLAPGYRLVNRGGGQHATAAHVAFDVEEVK